MATPVPPTDLPDESSTESAGPFHGLINSIQSRIISGLILALPIALTFWIIFVLFSTLRQAVLDPTALIVRKLLGYEGFNTPLNFWWRQIVSPATAMVLVLGFLYFLGLFVRSRLHRAIDWMLFRLPVVTIIYKGLSNVVQSLGDQFRSGRKAQRVVLVEFPHPGTRSLAFVTNALQDVSTGKTILTVCVLTGVMPPAGFTLFVPEESVTDIGWTANQAIQAIVSGGITTPTSIHYYEGLPAATGTGPIVDPRGRVIERAAEPTDSA